MSNATLFDSLGVLMPDLLPALMSESASARICLAAQQLPPITRGLLECRLAADSPQVDLQQNFHATDGEPEQFQKYIEMRTTLTKARTAWIRLSNFIRRWVTETDWRDHIPEIWCEYDLAGSNNLAAPSVFIALPSNLAPAERWLFIEEVLTILLEPSHWQRVKSVVNMCFQACAGDEWVAYLGLMLARPTKALRVNVKRLTPATLGAYLERVNWTGAIDTTLSLAQRLWPYLDRFTLALDVDTRVQPQLGLECVSKDWPTFLNELVRDELCAPAKREGALRWPGLTTPATTAAPWPAPLAARAVLRSPETFTTLAREISHVKLTLTPTAPTSAKIYLAFTHQWLTLTHAEPTSHL